MDFQTFMAENVNWRPQCDKFYIYKVMINITYKPVQYDRTKHVEVDSYNQTISKCFTKGYTKDSSIA